MKLLIAMIHSDDTAAVCDALLHNRMAFTRFASTGGFLRTGNATLLIGLEDDRVEAALALLDAHCSTRQAFVDANPAPLLGALTHAPVEVTVGGATVFVLDVAQFHKV